jgi:adenylylsulfate kinase
MYRKDIEIPYLLKSKKIKILVMGLPGSGKTTFSVILQKHLKDIVKHVALINADDVRTKFDDWDFSVEGRIRQSMRMSDICNQLDSKFVICDFVAPLPIMREIFSANYTIWMNTIESSRFDDTNKLFVPPEKCDYTITDKDTLKHVNIVCNNIIKLFKDE